MTELLLSLGATVAFGGIALVEWRNSIPAAVHQATLPVGNGVFILLGTCLLASYVVIWAARLA